jgi:tol-pal system protein YbgF
VVKVKPRAGDPPALDTSTEIEEPPPDQVAGLGRRRGAADDDAQQFVEPKDPGLVEAEFEDALSGLKTGNFSGATLKLQVFAATYPRHPRSDNALYFSGIGLLAMDDPDGAARAFEQVIADYPAGDARLDAMLKLAECRVRLDQKDGARELYTRIVATYPGTTAAAQARQRLAQLTH